MGPIPTTHTAITVNTIPTRVSNERALQILNHHLLKYHTPATVITTNPLVHANLLKIRSCMMGEKPDLNSHSSYNNEGLNMEMDNGGYENNALEGVELGEDTDGEGMTTDYEANTDVDVEIDRERRKAEKKARRKAERREAEELKRKRAHDE
ncbi:hypothetical protein BJ508DRAFT_413578 [Ascobolus immersus RN42]|uniref:Uncharacterized protein n=1 Tax=Ascobolus immersus RN42 TaxID=1160509 RepID=A0A3N4IP45_ASCIM|nr:hypothetical protein BJ508DRAFT_413578 [Ascobolus immersus RN42]